MKASSPKKLLARHNSHNFKQLRACYVVSFTAFRQMQYFLDNIVAITIQNIPPSVVMSQKTLKGFPLFSGSIQYSPSPLEPPESRMCLQDRPGWTEYHPTAWTRKKICSFTLRNISWNLCCISIVYGSIFFFTITSRSWGFYFSNKSTSVLSRMLKIVKSLAVRVVVNKMETTSLGFSSICEEDLDNFLV